MTTPSGTELTDEQLYFMVVEAMGWRVEEVLSDWMTGVMVKWWYAPGSSVRRATPPPSYMDSLDACATFEATITEKAEQSEYANLIARSINDDNSSSMDYMGATRFQKATATPRQRCIAFLRMKGVL